MVRTLHPLNLVVGLRGASAIPRGVLEGLRGALGGVRAFQDCFKGNFREISADLRGISGYPGVSKESQGVTVAFHGATGGFREVFGGSRTPSNLRGLQWRFWGSQGCFKRPQGFSRAFQEVSRVLEGVS